MNRVKLLSFQRWLAFGKHKIANPYFRFDILHCNIIKFGSNDAENNKSKLCSPDRDSRKM